MPLLAWIIALVITLESIAPYLVGLHLTPKDMVFLGTVHHPSDYFYYLSQFAQGAHRTLTTIDLYTAEHIPPTFVGWVNVLLGKLFGIIGANATIAYHVSVVLCTVLVLYLSYKLALFIQKSRHWATFSLFLFGLFHAFSIVREGKPSFGDYWNNLATPRVRLPAVPHQLIQTAASLFLILITLQWWQEPKTRTKKNMLIIGASSVILSSLQPALWATTISIMLFTIVVFLLKNRSKIKELNIYSTPVIITTISGIVPALYLNNVFTTLPFSQLKVWEVAQHTQFTLKHFLSATGPIFIFALLALPFIIKHSLSSLFTTFYVLISYTLFLSPIPQYLGISHARVMSTAAIVAVCIMASEGIKLLFMRLPKRSVAITLLLIVGVLTAYLIPNHLKSLELASTLNPKNAYHYLYKEDHELLLQAGRVGKTTDTYLVVWPYNVVFPALTGKRSYNGHPLLTIRPDQKDPLADAFFSQKMDDSTLVKFLTDYSITRVVAYQWTQFPPALIKNPISGGMLVSFDINTDYLKTYSK